MFSHIFHIFQVSYGSKYQNKRSCFFLLGEGGGGVVLLEESVEKKNIKILNIDIFYELINLLSSFELEKQRNWAIYWVMSLKG